MSTPTSRLQYLILSEAWYGGTNLGYGGARVDAVTFGRYVPEGGCLAEASFEWTRFPDGTIAVRLSVFHDAFRLFGDVPDLF